MILSVLEGNLHGTHTLHLAAGYGYALGGGLDESASALSGYSYLESAGEGCRRNHENKLGGIFCAVSKSYRSLASESDAAGCCALH